MMKFLRLTSLLLLASLSIVQGEEEGAEDLFFQANVHAAEEQFDAAVPLYEAALAQHPSANLHYNLGTAYYHLGEMGKARIHWEKTLAIKPRHTRAIRHLQLLKEELDLPEDELGIWMQIANFFSYNQWIWLGVGGFWLILFSGLAWQWKKRAWLALPAACGAAGLAAATVFLMLLNPARDEAVILNETAVLRVAPAPESPVSATLQPAQRVRVADRYREFLRVLLADGREGYVREDLLEKIW